MHSSMALDTTCTAFSCAYTALPVFCQVEWLREHIGNIPIRLVFESALELMGTTQLGGFKVGACNTLHTPTVTSVTSCIMDRTDHSCTVASPDGAKGFLSSQALACLLHGQGFASSLCCPASLHGTAQDKDCQC